MKTVSYQQHVHMSGSKILKCVQFSFHHSLGSSIPPGECL